MQYGHETDRSGRSDQVASAAIEIRSYRHVFALERRLYRIEGLRLGPAGVPLKGIGCFLAFACTGLLLDRLPLVGEVMSVVPWYLREGFGPALAACLITVIRVDGRPLHVAALALLRWRLGARHVAGLQSSSGTRWQLHEPVRSRRAER